MLVENETLKLLQPVAEEQLQSWLAELYGKKIRVGRRQVLRHRDLSYVERLSFDNALPESLIYKLVLPPWDVELELHESVLVPSTCYCPTLYLSAQFGKIVALFLEDLGSKLLADGADSKTAQQVGQQLAKVHRAYSYRLEDLVKTNVLRRVPPTNYELLAKSLIQNLAQWDLLNSKQERKLLKLAQVLALQLANEPISLVHGDLFAENIVLRKEEIFFIDWSWFAIIGVSLMDLATLTMDHFKNGLFREKEILIEAYAFESGRTVADINDVLPYARTLSKLFFLNWLVERLKRGILGTTVGPGDALISQVINELDD